MDRQAFSSTDHHDLDYIRVSVERRSAPRSLRAAGE